MNIGLIGCGRVGTTLFYLLRRKHRIVGVQDIKAAKEKKACHLLGLEKKVGLKTLCKKSTALFIATPDDAIVDAYRSIAPFITGQKYVFHFSGALPSTVFPKKQGVYRAVVHPFVTFPRLIIPPKRRLFPLYIEGDAQARAAAKRIFRSRSFSIRIISKKDKIYCHLAGVFSSNFIVALMMQTLKVMRRSHLSSKDLRETILPIIRDTLSNIEDHGVYKALSGPLQRGDSTTIKKHIKALCHDQLLLKTYYILSLAILETLPDDKNKKQLQKVLKSRISH
jgi:predicted short-subunit dehydrogenase-like oxidoreductase (DUF2520 family)